MSKKYRKRPVVVEAITFDELAAHQLAQTGSRVKPFEYGGHGIIRYADGDYGIATLEGVMTCARGDMLITGVAGEIYPCKPDIFAATYEAVAPCEEGSP